MGRVVAPFGVRGWLKVAPFTAAPATLLEHRTWWIEGPAGWAEHEWLEGRLHGDVIVARMAGIATREEAAAHKGSSIAIPRSDLPEPEAGEVYREDLPGFAVVNRRGEALGEVIDVQDNGGQALLRIRSPAGGERLIPFVPALVDEVDLDARRVVADWSTDW